MQIQVVSILSFQIYIVAGGTSPSNEYVETTEILTDVDSEFGGGSTWKRVGSLPFGVKGLAGATINNKVFMSG